MDSLEPSIILNHVITRSRTIPLPTLVCGWNEIQYVAWIESHVPRNIRELFKSSLDHYLGILEKQGKKTTCLEYPVLRTLLLDWERG
jgi:hypothetical protein